VTASYLNLIVFDCDAYLKEAGNLLCELCIDLIQLKRLVAFGNYSPNLMGAVYSVMQLANIIYFVLRYGAVLRVHIQIFFLACNLIVLCT
jgi:hypothetical protein